MKLRTILPALAVVAAALTAFGACSDNNTDDCPAKTALKNGDNCTSTDLTCPFDITITGCDGTDSTVASSCTCTSGQWVCADPGQSQCPPADDAAMDDGSMDDAAMDDAAMDDGATDGATDDGAADAGSDSAPDADMDASMDAADAHD